MSEKTALKGWSYSAWSSFNSCMFRFYRKYIVGDKEPAGYHMERGIDLHRKAEEYLKGNISALPREFKLLKPHYRELRALKPVVEQFWGVDERFRPHEGSSRNRSWCVMKMDAALPPTKKEPILFIQDLKSGREYDGHEDQGELYACIGAAKYPKIEEAQVEFWYVDQKDAGENVATFAYDLRDLRNLTKLWRERGKEVMSPRPRKAYKPNPSKQSCRYCFLRSDKGGPCKAWKEVE